MTTVPLGKPAVFVETRAPTVTDDAATLGVRQSYWWLRTDTGQWWICRDETTGAAVWDEVKSATALASIYQPLDATLTGLAALDGTTGLVEQDGATSFTKRAIGAGASTSVPTRADGDARWGQLSIANTWAGLQTINGGILLNNAGPNLIEFRATNVGAPTFTTRSIGAKIVLWPALGVSSADYAIGIESGALWLGVPETTRPIKFYAGTTLTMQLSGLSVLSGMSVELGGASGRTLFSEPLADSTLARTVHQLASYRNTSSTATGAIVFSAPAVANVMHQLRIKGLLYTPAHAVDVLVQGYRTTGAWSNTAKISLGTLDIQVRLAVNAAGNNCVILGDIGTVWSYPHFSIVEALFSHTGASDTYAQGWTAALVTDLSAFTQITATLANVSPAGLDPTLLALAGLTGAADRLPYFNGADTATLATFTAFARTLLDDVDAAAARTTLGAQASDATLTALAGLTTAADRLPYFTGVDTSAVTIFTSFARTLLDDADATAALGTLGAQAADATLTALAGMDTVAGALHQTAPDTFVKRVPSASNGVTISNADGIAGAPAFALTGVALALHTYSTGAGAGPLDSLRAIDVGSAAFADARALSGARVVTQNSSYQITPQDHGKIFRATSGSPTFTLPAWAALHPWFRVGFKARGTTITIARSGSDTIDGTTSISVTTGNSVSVGRTDTTGEMESY